MNANDLANSISITSQTTDSDHNNSFPSDLKELTTKLNLSLKDLKIAHLNICSLRNKIDELKYLQETCQFDIIAITESHLDAAVVNTKIAIDGLKLVRLDRTERKGGGCVLYYKEHLKAVHRTVACWQGGPGGHGPPAGNFWGAQK
jgi:hypothetical protein